MTRQVIRTPCSPRRSRRDSVDSIADGLFSPDGDYDETQVVHDHETSAICATKQNVPATDTEIISNDIIAGWAAMRTARLAIENWVKPLGPVSGWAQKFRECYDTACQSDGNTQEEVDRFLASVQEHINNGRWILSELYKSPAIRPQASTDAWADWLIAGDMLGTLHQGIAILETHLDILAPRCPVPSDATSSSRQWVGFANLL